MKADKQDKFIADIEQAVDDIESADICEQNIDDYAKRICEILREYGFCKHGGEGCSKS